MAAKPVARRGDVRATNGTRPVPGSTGKWTAGSITETTKSKFTSDGSPIVVQAKCVFSYSGDTTSSPSTKVTDSSTVTLRPKSRKLVLDGESPLVHEDAEEDQYGNKLSVSSTAAWSTS